jgi:hypothetical protein
VLPSLSFKSLITCWSEGSFSLEPLGLLLPLPPVHDGGGHLDVPVAGPDQLGHLADVSAVPRLRELLHLSLLLGAQVLTHAFDTLPNVSTKGFSDLVSSALKETRKGPVPFVLLTGLLSSWSDDWSG